MTDRNIFIYGETEVSYLKKRDKKLAEVMEKVGPIEREVIPDLFAALVNSIIGQQISTKAHKTIWKKMVTVLGEITPQVIDSLSDEELQQFGITFKKVAYIKSAAQKVLSGELNIEIITGRTYLDRYTIIEHRFTKYLIIHLMSPRIITTLRHTDTKTGSILPTRRYPNKAKQYCRPTKISHSTVLFFLHRTSYHTKSYSISG